MRTISKDSASMAEDHVLKRFPLRGANGEQPIVFQAELQRSFTNAEILRQQESRQADRILLLETQSGFERVLEPRKQKSPELL